MTKLNCEIESIEDFEGAKARVYGIYIEERETSLFDRFNKENEEEFGKELASIERRLQLMASKYGVREDWLKLNEGPPDLHVVALYDDPDSNLRCYGYDLVKSFSFLVEVDVSPKQYAGFKKMIS